MQQPFEQTVHRHGATVLRITHSVLGPGPDADDAWSETFLAAMVAWPDLDSDLNVEAWLVRVAQRKAIDILRKTGRQAITVSELPEPAADQGDGNDIGFEIWELIESLPRRQRLAVSLHHLAGFPYAEIAEMIGGSPDAARRAASDGIRQLRQQYQSDPLTKGKST